MEKSATTLPRTLGRRFKRARDRQWDTSTYPHDPPASFGTYKPAEFDLGPLGYRLSLESLRRCTGLTGGPGRHVGSTGNISPLEETRYRYHLFWQLRQYASVSCSLRDRPVARSDTPPVKIAPAALPPLMPFLFIIFFVWHCPRS